MTKNNSSNINTNIILNNTLINNYESATIKELRIQLNKMDNKSSLDSMVLTNISTILCFLTIY